MTTVHRDDGRPFDGPDTPVPEIPSASGGGRNGRSGRAWSGRDPRYRHPWLAAVLSFVMPGLGQVYVGYYREAFVNILVIASLVTLLAGGGTGDLEPLLGFFLVFYWLYQTVDAARRGTLYNLYLDGLAGAAGVPETPPPAADARLGGIVMITVGVLAFLNTMFHVPLGWLRQWWPLALVLLGAWMLRRGRG